MKIIIAFLLRKQSSNITTEKTRLKLLELISNKKLYRKHKYYFWRLTIYYHEKKHFTKLQLDSLGKLHG